MKLMTMISELLTTFGVTNSYQCGSLLVSNCPIHDGDNISAFNINIDPDSNHYGSWFCNTKGCHHKYGQDVIALTHCFLDKKYDKTHSFVEVIKFCEEFTKGVISINGDIPVRQTTLDDILLKNKKVDNPNKGYTRDVVRSRLVFPATYYLNRGFSETVLNELDIGLCNDPKSEMYNRIVFPVYDETDTYMVGCVGRSINDENPRRWANKKGFSKSNYLYNYNKAIKRISRTSSVIVVEGQGDVIRLYEAGIINAVGLFGSEFHDPQEFLLQKSGALNVVILTDNDEAGEKCRKDMNEKLKYSFNIINIVPNKKDVGDMTIQEINKVIKPQIQGLY